jgi:hypothetical protein
LLESRRPRRARTGRRRGGGVDDTSAEAISACPPQREPGADIKKAHRKVARDAPRQEPWRRQGRGSLQADLGGLPRRCPTREAPAVMTRSATARPVGRKFDPRPSIATRVASISGPARRALQRGGRRGGEGSRPSGGARQLQVGVTVSFPGRARRRTPHDPARPARQCATRVSGSGARPGIAAHHLFVSAAAAA